MVMLGASPGWGFIIVIIATVALFQPRITQALDDGDSKDLERNETSHVHKTTPETKQTSPEYVETTTESVKNCVGLLCDGPLCVRKCCPAGEHLTEDFECAQHEVGLWSPSTTFLKGRKDVDESKLQVLIGFPPGCSEFDHIEVEDSFQLLPDGCMLAPAENWSQPASGYCLENVHGYEGELGVFCTASLEDYEYEIAEERKECKFQAWLYPVLMSFSVFFLILTLIVYAGVPKLREKTYGRCLISMVVALLIYYIMQIFNFIITIGHNGICITLAFFTHWSGLAIFFWFNVMAFELWRTVCSGKLASNDILKFKKYSAYAWGVSFLIAIITLIIHHLPESYENLLRPNFTGTTCFLEGLKERWAYLYWVIAVLTLANLAFFTHVCYTIYKTKQSAQKKSDGCFFIFLKMFLIIGFSWFLEMFSTSSCWWTIGDLPNLLQGIFIFLATVCNDSVLKDVSQSPRLQGLGVFVQSVRQKIPSASAIPSKSDNSGTSGTPNTRASRFLSKSGRDSPSNASSQDNIAIIPLETKSS